MIPMRQFEISLNTQSLSNKLFQTVVQGSQDTELLVTVLQDGKSISIADDANIILNVLYNGKTNPAYETKTGDADFKATITDGKITIPFTEPMTALYGKHSLFLTIEDVNISCVIGMEYEVLKNDAYDVKSIPNNLPSIENLVKQIATKLNIDMSNADDVALKAKLSALGIGEDETPKAIVTKLSSLTGNNRLPNSAVKDSLGVDLADVNLDKLDEKFQATDSGKQQKLNTQAINTKLNTDMANVNTLLFSREMKLTNAYQDLAKRPSSAGKTAAEIKALFEANRFEEQDAIDFSDPQFSATTLYMAYQFTNSDQTITQELPAVSDNKIIMVEILLSSSVKNPTLTFTPKSGDNIQGVSKPYTITGKDGYIGYFLPLQNENAWQFIPHEISHEFSLAVSDDKGNVHIGINSMEFKNATVEEKNGILEVTPDNIEFTEINGNKFNSNKITSMDKSVNIHNLNGSADLSVRVPGGLDGVFAKLSNPEPLNTDFHDQRPYFGNRFSMFGNYIGYDMQNKAFTIQDGDPNDDPNISGGTNIRGGFFAKFKNKPIASNDGYVELKLVDVNTKDYLLDDNGNPYAVRKDYKAGEVIDKELLVISLNARGQQKIAFEIDASFAGQILELDDDSCVYLQALNKDYNTGMAEVIFEQQTGYTIHQHHVYYGTNFMNYAAALVKDVAEQEINDYHEILGNNLFISSKGKAKVSISNYQLVVKDNGTDLPVFSVGKILTKEETRALANKNLRATVKITDKNNAFDYSLMKWTGDGPATLPIITGYQNEQPQFATGWEKVQNKFIPEDVVSGVHTDTNAFTVPADAKQVAFMIYPHESQTPTTLKLNDFELDVVPAFTKSYIDGFSDIKEKTLEYSDYSYKSVVRVPEGDIDYRYTVNDTATNIPVGVFSGGDGQLFNNNAWNDPGSSDPEKVQGDIESKVDGKMKSFEYSARIGNETNTENDVNFWLEEVGGSEVPGSRYTGKIPAKTLVTKETPITKFSFDVKAGKSYRLKAQSNIKDGFFIESKNRAYPLVEIIYDFREIEEV